MLGWLYQYYISELKSEYMARKTAYKKEEIPAVTQLFTPKWIVQYLVHNSLGRSWLLHHPESGLKAKMPYYIEPAPQEPEVEAELKRLFSGDLNPEDIKLLDPAMGSGHILVTAYEVLREIYLERGYQRQQCARLILEKNLYGLDIDLRATEIACFALIMKAREDDPSILSSGSGLRLNLLSFRDCTPDERTDIVQNLSASPDQKADLTALLTLFEQGTLFGSLIQIPEELTKKLPTLSQWLENTAASSELLASKAAESSLVFVRLAQILGQKYDQVVGNPPYLGSKYQTTIQREYIFKNYKIAKADLFAAFMLKAKILLKESGFLSYVVKDTMMTNPIFESFRVEVKNSFSFQSILHLGARAFDSISGEIVSVVAFSYLNKPIEKNLPVYIDLTSFLGEEKKYTNIQNKNLRYNHLYQDNLDKLPGTVYSFGISGTTLDLFANKPKVETYARPRSGITTGDNDYFIRFWYEVVRVNRNIEDYKYANCYDKWVPLNGGSNFKKWFGSNLQVILWENHGEKIINAGGSTIANPDFQFKQGLTWSVIAGSNLSVRLTSKGCIFSAVGLKAFPENDQMYYFAGFLNSKVSSYFLSVISDGLHILSGDVANLPVEIRNKDEIDQIIGKVILSSKSDWDAFETSWDFQALTWLPSVLPDYLKDTDIPAPDRHSLASCWDTWRAVGQHWTSEMLRLEEENNRLFIDAYGLQDELTPDVPIEQITLTVNPWYRYKPRKKATEDDSSGPGIEMEILDEGGSPNQDWSEEPRPQIYPEGEERMREDGARELVSYAIGCAMGRYSLDTRGLIYAEAGGQGFDHAQYPTFPADDDGILCITDLRWFDEDGADRVETFVRTVWGAERHDENMTWLASGLGVKGNESPDETLRRYLSGDFYKDHLQTYKKRPIYWKFSSGKEKAFEALVYLHRYNKGTLSRMRMQFVVPLSGKIRGQMDTLDAQIQGAVSTAERKRLDKLKTSLSAKLSELAAFDSVINHYAQMQIELDLDDGVRVNYGKFGPLLANVKDVVGKGEE